MYYVVVMDEEFEDTSVAYGPFDTKAEAMAFMRLGPGNYSDCCGIVVVRSPSDWKE